MKSLKNKTGLKMEPTDFESSLKADGQQIK